jgi:hypothetical protein
MAGRMSYRLQKLIRERKITRIKVDRKAVLKEIEGAEYDLTKAENSLRMVKIAIQEKAYDNAVMSAVHSAVNALDALTVSNLGKRASGTHTDVLSLMKGILEPSE